jgi:hypothetical protein
VGVKRTVEMTYMKYTKDDVQHNGVMPVGHDPSENLFHVHFSGLSQILAALEHVSRI